MIIYYLLIAVGVVMVAMAIANLINSKKIEKNFENYLLLISSSKAYFIGSTLFSVAILAVIAYQVSGYIFNIKIFAIVFFFTALFFLSLSHLIYYLTLEKKLSDYKEYFKDFEIDLDNRCQKMMLKHIYSKTKDLNKIKEVFKMNKKLCN